MMKGYRFRWRGEEGEGGGVVFAALIEMCAAVAGYCYEGKEGKGGEKMTEDKENLFGRGEGEAKLRGRKKKGEMTFSSMDRCFAFLFGGGYVQKVRKGKRTRGVVVQEDNECTSSRIKQ